MEPVKIESWADIQELVSMSIGTDRGKWWADPLFGSELWLLQQEGKVTGKTAGTVQRMILESLQWLKDDGLVKNITCTAELAGKNEINYTVIVDRPGNNPVIVKDVWRAV